VDTIAGFMQPFGFGQPTGIDLQGELRGVLPSTEWKRKAYRRAEQQRWYAGETISLGIGQGYNNYTIMQLANALATLSTGGQRHVPHLVRDVVDVVSGARHPVAPTPLAPLPLNPEYVDVVRKAMVGVNNDPAGGTGYAAFLNAGYVSGGKTGTAQVVGIKANEKYNASKVSEYQRDNALFIAFAPADHPTIAIAMVVENVGFGAQYAGPIARRVMDYWIKGIYPTDEDIAAVQAGTAGPPKTQGVPIAQATNIRLGTNHSPMADDSAGTPLPGVEGPAAAASAIAAYAAASGASAPSAAERAAAVASAASASRVAAAAAALANAGSGAVALPAPGASAPARRASVAWTPTANPGRRKP
jgi:penicillin-binding protein 2